MNLPHPFDFTQSKLQDYMDCPYRFYLRYLLDLKWPALLVDDAITFEQRGQTGARFHRLIQQYLLGVPQNQLDELAAADINPEVKTWWDDFLVYIPPQLTGQQFVEMILTTTLDEQRLLAKYDLILRKNERHWIIFDWKTSQNLPRKDWLMDRMQTRLYPWVLTQMINALGNHEASEPDQITMKYWFATHPESPVELRYNHEMYNADTAFFRKIINEILSKDETEFTRTLDSKKCHFCVYRSHCDRGIKAGELAAYEDFSLENEAMRFDMDFDQISEIQF